MTTLGTVILPYVLPPEGAQFLHSLSDQDRELVGRLLHHAFEEGLKVNLKNIEPWDKLYKQEMEKYAIALWEVVDAVAGTDRPRDLQGHGIDARRAEEICSMAMQGRTFALTKKK